MCDFALHFTALTLPVCNPKWGIKGPTVWAISLAWDCSQQTLDASSLITGWDFWSNKPPFHNHPAVIHFLWLGCINLNAKGILWIGTCMPLVMSMISIMISMIWAPPIMVLIKEACPGQSTRVTCSWSHFKACKRGGTSAVKEEKPRSSVMPRSLLCGCLSRAAVDNCDDRAATAEERRSEY